ncbi:hypothetical protein [Nonomuraea aridisoli]|uniref:Lipoprotein n=1 Tax=Nonomuraea aridisoli TaxID=2070368 RepID=A0A2W2EL53_9ACTN|nr:hypothetical protein [Nonomuraea aridisoli]PZG23113.1 hypothetical protein C1J01_01815 [Nonomuraea aridisoli]
MPFTHDRRTHVGVRLAAACLFALLGTSACAKTLVLVDAEPTASATPPSSSVPNTGLQLVGGTAAEHGLTGDGGTPVGAIPQPQPAKWVQLAVASSDAVGAYLTDVNGSTLYRSDHDAPNVSSCADACALVFPPVTIREGGKVYLSPGVDPSAVGAIQRPDGTIQLTIGGRPVYRHTGDTRPGDMRGRGADDAWYPIAPTGAKATPH